MKQSLTVITKRRANILNYFFDIKSQDNARDVKRPDWQWVKPKDIKAHLSINGSLDYRTFIRDIEFFYRKYIILDEYEIDKDGYEKLDSKKKYNTKYMLTDNKKIKFHIPAVPSNRFSYAQAITSLMIATDETIYGNTVLPTVNTSNYQGNSQIQKMITYLFDGIVRDTFLSVKVYDCFHYNKGSLLSILVELAEFNQHINIDIEINGSKVSYKNVILKSISLNEDMSIGLNFADSNILVDSLENIKNISMLTKHYPKSDTGKTTILRVNKKQIKDEMQKHGNINRMKEWFVTNEETVELDKDLDECINDILKSKLDEKEFLSRTHLLPVE
ncbi:MAG: hypothetical protein GQ570_05645 [Helicobacteraceae bacterium]|nr:hypothetical protein [Helicobacteraceae bacterium]